MKDAIFLLYIKNLKLMKILLKTKVNEDTVNITLNFLIVTIVITPIFIKEFLRVKNWVTHMWN